MYLVPKYVFFIEWSVSNLPIYYISSKNHLNDETFNNFLTKVNAFLQKYVFKF